MKFFKIRKDSLILKPVAWKLNSNALSKAFELDDDYVGMIIGQQYPISLSFMADEIIDLDNWQYIKSRQYGNNSVVDEDYKKKLLFYAIGAI